MPQETPFQILLSRVRSGDQQAAMELVRRYEPALRRTIRARLRDRQLRRLLDSTDICQSVLFDLFGQLTTGQYAVSTPEELLKLLAVMARNHLINQALHQQARRRDHRRLAADPVEEWPVADPGSSPSEHVAAEELARRARDLLTPEEQQLVELRKQGQEWSEIARRVGRTPEAVRKHLGRALARVAQVLGFEGAGA
jgi:RNA polymerase sigma-70 factor (ECF subfamily)